MTKITSASEARALMPENEFNEELKKISDRIENAAKSKRSSLRMTRDMYTCEEGVLSLTDVGESISKSLKSYGYTVTEFWDEGGQHVDFGYRVSWALPKW